MPRRDADIPGEPARAAVFGGTFDPFHNGHLAVTEQVGRLLDAEVWIVPSLVPPHRRAAEARPEDRLAMIEAALAGRPGTRVLDLELRRAGPSYTVETLDALEAEHPDTELWIVLGTDAVREIAAWHRADDLLRHARFAVVNRSGTPEIGVEGLRSLGFDTATTRRLTIDSPDVSASEVRRRVGAGEAIGHLVPPEVAAIIAARHLYAAGRGAGTDDAAGVRRR